MIKPFALIKRVPNGWLVCPYKEPGFLPYFRQKYKYLKFTEETIEESDRLAREYWGLVASELEKFNKTIFETPTIPYD